MNIKIFLFIFYVVAQLANGRNIRHETIIKRRLSETRVALAAMKERHLAILLPMEDAFMRNFTAITQHGEFVTSYLLRNAHFEIENIEFEASKQGIHLDECIAKVLQVMDSLSKATDDDINECKVDFIARYRHMYEHFVQSASNIETELKESEKLLIDCHLEKGCFEIVLAQIEEIEKFINAGFVNDFKHKIEGFMMKMQQQYHAIQGFYLTLYESIRENEETFRTCYKEAFNF